VQIFSAVGRFFVSFLATKKKKDFWENGEKVLVFKKLF